jgi:hypothetical protein
MKKNILLKKNNSVETHAAMASSESIVASSTARDKRFKKILGLLYILLLLFCMLSHSTAFAETKSDTALNKVHSKTIVFITGAFVSNSCWDEWKTYFESKGYTTIAPAWPFKNGTAAELRATQ